MLILNKVLAVFFLPTGLVVIAVVVGTLWKKRWLVYAAVAGLMIASMPVVGSWMLGMLERSYPRLEVATTGPADVVLVLSGAAGPPSPEGYTPNWTDAVERFNGGVDLVKAGRAPLLLFTGARLPGNANSENEGDRMRARAIERGVPVTSIAVTDEVENTSDEAREAVKFCAEHGLKKVILVTTAWHMPRAMLLFRKSKLEVIPFPVDYRDDPGRQLTLFDFVPSATVGLANTETAMRERYGIAFYALIGR